MLTNFPFDPLLDLAPWVGQRQATFRFDRVNAVTGEDMGQINPIRGSASLSHDTSRTIKRQLNMTLGATDSAQVNVLQDRILPTMVFPDGSEYPLGRYLFTQQSSQVTTAGEISNVALADEMFMLDQQITEAFDASSLSLTATQGVPSVSIGTGIANRGISVARALQFLLEDFNVEAQVEASPFVVNQAWSAGSTRGNIMDSMALTCDYFSPWFDNNGILQYIRSFNPALKIPDFDWDEGHKVLRSGIVKQADALTAPNRFIVISNASGSPQTAVFGSADVPVNAPNSLSNRGFLIPSITDAQVLNTPQAQAMANNLMQRRTIFETVSITTAPDPRHDSYNVINWQGDLWLELNWSLQLQEGAPMSHTLRRAYR